MTSRVLDSLTKGSHYLLSINSIPQNQLLGQDSKNVNCGISAIISKTYTDSNIIIVYDDTAPTYVHSGIPITLEQFDVVILDPITKNLTKDFTGVNHTIYLQVINY